ncbi:MAG TPA: glycoside hydrolase family 2, partial [Epulopiscium sp.]|nr:glycoside hydrolase family 2 [Candidatus Epulonipiscium sp.]
CNMNYYRITQRPVQEEIYDYCDMLGMMNQCDMPLFSFLRRNQVCEVIRQTEEMEHLIRSHPSTIMVSFINEPVCIRRTSDPDGKFSKRYEVKGHRHLLRDELEAFFAAARKVIYIKNPDRVIKNVEGDYDPPTSEGMPDFHCYTMWYTNHAQPIGKLYKGYLPPVKEGWMIGCGEYGAEGLDHYDVMMKHYPKEWLATDKEGNWYPDKIVRAQTNSLHGDWFQEQRTMKNWIKESQKHQANATSMMTDAFRRRADCINHIAIHLLIDAWPSGWMKTLVGVDRVPKPSYFAYADSLVPFRVNLRCDRRYVYGGETIDVEAWLLNDLSKAQEVKIVTTVSIDGKAESSYKLTANVDEVTAKCVGIIPALMPKVKQESIAQLHAWVMDLDGNLMNTERMEFTVYPPVKTIVEDDYKVACFGDYANALADAYKIKAIKDINSADTIVVSDLGAVNKTDLALYLNNGGNVVLILPDEEAVEVEIGSLEIKTKACPAVFFAATDESTKKYHFTMLYNKNGDYIDFTGNQSIECNKEGKNLVYSYAKRGFDSASGAKGHLPFVKQVEMGKGKLTIISLLLEGRTTYNPNIDQFLIDCIQNNL